MENEDRVLDWGPNHDPRSRLFAVNKVITTPPARRNKLWRIGQILDQGREGACVGFGWTAEVLSTPVSVDLARVKFDIPREPTEFAKSVYREAQKIDEWAGEDYEGTSTLAGAKVLRKYGLLKEYRWAFNVNEVIDAVLVKGPVVIGIWWYDNMYNAPNGILHVGGQKVGGHCLTIVGYRLAKDSKTGTDSFILQNSWGNDWGVNGLAEMSVAQMAELLADDGEACVPVSRSYGRQFTKYKICVIINLSPTE